MLKETLEDKYPSISTIVSKLLFSEKDFDGERRYSSAASNVYLPGSSLRGRLRSIHGALQGWNARYDYSLWERVEDYLNDSWSELESYLYLCVEYELYDELKKIFIELRNFLHTTGRTQERLYLAAWLFQKARQLADEETELFALSTIVWSYTCTGCYQDIPKAAMLWQFLIRRILQRGTKFEPVAREFNSIVQDSTEGSIFPELLLESYESGVRIYIRQYNLDAARVWTARSDKLIDQLFQNHLISSRLRTRCRTAQDYHRGIISYLGKDSDSARATFEEVYKNAERIGWERVQKGAQSWLATVAKEQNRLEECSKILSTIGVSDNITAVATSSRSLHARLRDAFCHLIKADLENKRGKIDAEFTHQEAANRIFEEHTSNSDSSHTVVFGPHNLLTPM